MAVDGGLRRLDSQRSTVLTLKKEKDVSVPADQVDFATELGRAEVSRHHDVTKLSQVEISFLFAPASGALVLREFIGRECVEREPAQGAEGVTGEQSGNHCRLGTEF